ncbi:acyl-coenzyme A diphosphatase NUDT19 [Lethenteron reissneri]|uniref:acyl-coenzyme A diphosphatase NUDT19 n=1 Tax=Lethenteron reissneri TaxID=7753 RepID=UPI002AB6CB3F|nr:acyl-coenzyme A diphosphatase NUDT19 [Lethenteron reissneri]
MNRSGVEVEGPTVMLVHVLDQNDNRPRFQHEPFHAQLPEHAPRGHHVIHVEADDPDNPETGNAELRYSLGPPRPPPANRSAVSFAIDPLRGDITTTSDPQLLDREALATLTYELVVSVSDMAGGDSGLVRSSTVTVTIADINDNPPVFHPTTRRRPNDAPSLATAVPDSPALRRWRALVLSDARLFAAMCSELRVVPDVWALHEWSDWLTPVPLAPAAPGASPPRRFDAVFFLCCLAEAPAASHDDHETVGAQWVRPPELLSQHEAGALWLAPPQQYEVARLCRVPALLTLADFARRRAALGMHRWMPVRVPDPAGGGGLVGVLPGDELYPAEPDEIGGDHGGGAVVRPSAAPASSPPRPGTAPRLHRTTTARGRAGVLLTVAPEFGHLAPFVREDDAEEKEEEDKTKKKPESGIESRL